MPASVEGQFLHAVALSGAALINMVCRWHHPQSAENTKPHWPNHGVRFLSGSEQNPDRTGKDVKLLAKRVLHGAMGAVHKFMDHGADFVSVATAGELARKMNALIRRDLIDPAGLQQTRLARERQVQVDSGLDKDPQLNADREPRRFATVKLICVAPPRAILAAEHGRLYAVRLSTRTRRSLGWLSTDLSGRVLSLAGTPLPALLSTGEAAGFGGGLHGYRSLEAIFPSGCFFSERSAGRHASSTTAP